MRTKFSSCSQAICLCLRAREFFSCRKYMRMTWGKPPKCVVIGIQNIGLFCVYVWEADTLKVARAWTVEGEERASSWLWVLGWRGGSILGERRGRGTCVEAGLRGRGTRWKGSLWRVLWPPRSSETRPDCKGPRGHPGTLGLDLKSNGEWIGVWAGLWNGNDFFIPTCFFVS